MHDVRGCHSLSRPRVPRPGRIGRACGEPLRHLNERSWLIASIVYWKNPAHEPQVLAAAVKRLHMPANVLQPGLALYRDEIVPTYPLVTRAGMEFLLKMQKVNAPVTDFYENSYVEPLQAGDFAATAGR